MLGVLVRRSSRVTDTGSSPHVTDRLDLMRIDPYSFSIVGSLNAHNKDSQMSCVIHLQSTITASILHILAVYICKDTVFSLQLWHLGHFSQ